MVETTLHVEGMHCPKCEMRVEKSVGAIEGVSSVKADHTADSVVVSFDGQDATMDAVKAAITSLDFEVI